jgi:hypothetical protein
MTVLALFSKLGITGMTVPNLLYPMLRFSELEIRSDLMGQLVFHE